METVCQSMQQLLIPSYVKLFLVAYLPSAKIAFPVVNFFETCSTFVSLCDHFTSEPWQAITYSQSHLYTADSSIVLKWAAIYWRVVRPAYLSTFVSLCDHFTSETWRTIAYFHLHLFTADSSIVL